MVGVFVRLAGLNKTWASGIGGAVVAHLKMSRESKAGKVRQLSCSFRPDFAKTVFLVKTTQYLQQPGPFL